MSSYHDLEKFPYKLEWQKNIVFLSIQCFNLSKIHSGALPVETKIFYNCPDYFMPVHLRQFRRLPLSKHLHFWVSFEKELYLLCNMGLCRVVKRRMFSWSNKYKFHTHNVRKPELLLVLSIIRFWIQEVFHHRIHSVLSPV